MTTTKRFAALSALALVLALLAGGGALAQRVESRLEGLIDDVAGLAMSLGVSSPMYTDTDLRESIQSTLSELNGGGEPDDEEEGATDIGSFIDTFLPRYIQQYINRSPGARRPGR
mmetsp:Transcript_15344/g.38966  ORF Transcript_15344/g.38966 Transcript_15344/m.38966 type:complete len:115 (-) Transcript_15344:172-516(-)